MAANYRPDQTEDSAGLLIQLADKCESCGIPFEAFVKEKLEELEERARILLTPPRQWFADNSSRFAAYAEATLRRPLSETEAHGPDSHRERAHRRFFPERRAIYDESTKRTLLRQASNRCVMCGIPLTTADMHVDHILPLSEGGSNHTLNLQALCADCNLGKSDYFEATATAAARPWWEPRTSLINGEVAVTSTKRYCVLRRDRSACQLCGAQANGTHLKIVQRVSAVRGGQPVFDNLTARCIECLERGDRHEDQRKTSGRHIGSHGTRN